MEPNYLGTVILYNKNVINSENFYPEAFELQCSFGSQNSSQRIFFYRKLIRFWYRNYLFIMSYLFSRVHFKRIRNQSQSVTHRRSPIRLQFQLRIEIIVKRPRALSLPLNNSGSYRSPRASMTEESRCRSTFELLM